MIETVVLIVIILLISFLVLLYISLIIIVIGHITKKVTSFLGKFVKKSFDWVHYKSPVADLNVLEKSSDSISEDELKDQFKDIKLFNGIKINSDETYEKGLIGINNNNLVYLQKDIKNEMYFIILKKYELNHVKKSSLSIYIYSGYCYNREKTRNSTICF